MLPLVVVVVPPSPGGFGHCGLHDAGQPFHFAGGASVAPLATTISCDSTVIANCGGRRSAGDGEAMHHTSQRGSCGQIWRM